MYKMKSDINFSLTHELLENAENERIHTSYAQEKAILECVIIPGISEPPVRTLRATIPENERHIFR